MKMQKSKILSIFIVFSLLFCTISLIKGYDPGEEMNLEEDYNLILVEVENIDTYERKESFVEVIIGIGSHIEIQCKEENLRDFGDVVSMYSNDTESIEEKWSTISEKNYIPVAEIRFMYKYYHGMSVVIPESWIEPLSDAWFTTEVEKNFEVSCTEDTLDWGVDQIDAEKVWGGGVENAVDIVAGEPDGTGANILIIDTGWDVDHEDSSLDSDNYYRFYGESDDDELPHGTHVTGIINCQDDEDNYIGVAPGATIYMGKAGDYTLDVDAIVDAIEWGIDLDVDIISMSFGSFTPSSAMEETLSEAYSRGIFLVAASGRTGVSTVTYPAKYDTVMAVGATDSSNERCDGFSNYGDELEIMAPGEDIYSTIPDDDYAQLSGTSMACPMVAGVAALIKGEYPDLSGPIIREILIQSATDLEDSGWDDETGYGLVDAEAAMDLAADYNQIIAEERSAIDGDGDFLHVRTMHQIVHGSSGEEKFPIYLHANYEYIPLVAQCMYFKIYMKVYYRDSWFKMWGWPPESGTDYYWDYLPADMVEWSGSSADYEINPDGDLWEYQIGSNDYFLPYGNYLSKSHTDSGYGTESNSGGWTYLGYVYIHTGIPSGGEYDALMELDIDNTIAADYGNGYSWTDLGEGIEHTVYIQKVYIKIEAEYKAYFNGWQLDKSKTIILGDESSPDYNDIDLASGDSPS